MQPVRVRTAGRGRPALVTGVFLLVASLVLLVSPLPIPPDARSTSPTSRSFADVLVQGDGVAAAVAAVGGRSLAALPIVGGLLARVPDDRAGSCPPTPASGPSPTPTVPSSQGRRRLPPGVWTARRNPRPVRLASASGGPRSGGRGSRPAAGRGVGVGVLDTGIAASGDLAGRVVASADLSGEWSFTDSYGHGTFMAGLIAGRRPGRRAGRGRARSRPGRPQGGRSRRRHHPRPGLAALQLADAARDRFNLRVLNISLGAPADDPATAPLTEAVERLWADGITVVAASGNEGGGVEAPGLDPYVLTVGAVDGAGAVPAWSSRGTDFAGRAKPDLVAPGVGLVGLRAPGSTIDLANPSARVGDHYFRGSGTSMSTAVVAGAAALVAAEHPGWGPDRIKAALTARADPIGQNGSGAGRPRPGGGAGHGHGAGGQRRPVPAADGRPGRASRTLPSRWTGSTGGPAAPTGSAGRRPAACPGRRRGRTTPTPGRPSRG